MSVLRSALFHIYVSELPTGIKSESIQQADYITLCDACEVSNMLSTIKTLEFDIPKLSKWSSENGRIFTSGKFKHGRYASLSDSISLDWLPVTENIDFSTVTYTCKSISDNHWPA